MSYDRRRRAREAPAQRPFDRISVKGRPLRLEAAWPDLASVRTSDREVDVLEDVVIQLGKYCSMRSERHVGTTTVRLAGEFDLACKEPFQEELSLVLDGETVTFILDLRGLQFMDSTGLGTLVELDGLARRDGFEFTILCDQGLVRRALKETGLDGMLPVADPYGGLLPPSDSPV